METIQMKRTEVKINPNKVMQERIAVSVGLDKYDYIMRQFYKVNVSSDNDFQRIFDGFYRVRRNDEWRKCFYDLFEGSKKCSSTFEQILKEIYDQTGRVEASFSSKMLATIDSDKPIWDRYVLQNLQITFPVLKDKQKQMEVIIDTYHDIENWYQNFMQRDNAKECIEKFNEMLPDYRHISDIKKIDFFLWSAR